MKNLVILLWVLCCSGWMMAQNLHLSYYLPGVGYNPTVDTPAEFLGHLPGEWHLTHDQVVYYAKQLERQSERVVYAEYARSYENRPLFHLIISHPDNIANLERIRDMQQALCDPYQDLDTENMPVIVNLGYTVHGNEQSGVGAAVLIAYYLAAGESRYLDSLLRNTVILLDPCLNPDGMNRFSSWVNMHKSKNLVSHPAAREFNEPWPGSRTNHYWFDLNRDWLPVVHPESRGRIKRLQEWQPNIVCDYHEMGTNSTYFFQPGVPERNNPLTPVKTFELTEKIGRFHAKYLDALGSLYYSKEDFDDFYFGKGSTYPDINGAIGILFEQASSRGHLQDSKFGPLSYPFTIRNQVQASLSSLEAGFRMRKELLDWKKEFYQSALREVARHPVKGYVFHSERDFNKTLQFIDILDHHNIEVYLSKTVIKDMDGKDLGQTFVVPLDQAQHRLIRGIFETMTAFQDSLFYDVSSWTLPLGMNIPYASVYSPAEIERLKGERFDIGAILMRPEPVPQTSYAWVLEAHDYFSPAALYRLLDYGVQVLSNHSSFTANTHIGEKQFDKGSLIIPLQIQNRSTEDIRNILQEISNQYMIPAYSLLGGQAIEGVDLGSPAMELLQKPVVAILGGSGMYSNEVGEVWHFLDQKMNIPGMVLDANQFNRANWQQITHLIVCSGSPDLSDAQVNKLREWVQRGGTIIGLHRGNTWLKSKNLAFMESVQMSGDEDTDSGRKQYEDYRKERGAKLLSGAIFSMEVDLTHPLFYGYEDKSIAVFRRGTDFYQPAKNAYATPAVYSKEPLLSGYVPASLKPHLGGHAAVLVSGVGSGKVISILDNPLFRGYWSGTHRLFMNAIYYGPGINRATTQYGE